MPIFAADFRKKQQINMKKTFIILSFCVLGIVSQAQIIPKINGLYLPVAVFNPAVEFPLSSRYTYQAEVVWSPVLHIHNNGIKKPMLFLIFMNETRRYFDERNKGWYAGANAGIYGFKMSKPEISNGKLRLKNSYGKGFGLMFGIVGGYEYIFKERWILDCYFGWSFMASWYNDYSFESGINMYPGHYYEEPEYPDPFNGSNEWLPNKIGVSIGYIFK